ncbi:uncharacterized protein LOC142975027 [Anticarsia gemmatalis]|uniref:uncharacterized protein LOC142975027 n=1 Tax=Anticarsia gemmatalis TaxID=129554 RepID=UPI003F774C02
MDCHRRRGRRGRGHSYTNFPVPNRSGSSQPPPRHWCFANSVTSFLILSSLIGIIYLMLDQHCQNCKAKCDMSNLTRTIEDIANNLSVIKHGYFDLERKLSDFSQELPKVEGQIEILEALANSVDPHEMGWSRRTHLPIAEVETLLKRPIQEQVKNISKMCTQCVPKPIKPKPILVN